jgi:hypothetical protein
VVLNRFASGVQHASANAVFQERPADAPRWDAILMSAGGNDLIEALPLLIRSHLSPATRAS